MNRPKIGLALGSGGARGLAHIGVLKVLKENNIPIDFIAGVSIGSIAGAYYSLNENVDLLERKMLQLTKKDLLKLIDLTSPKRALISGNKRSWLMLSEQALAYLVYSLQ
jgi:NTE family protein